MNKMHEPWKDVLHVEVHVPGFNIQKSIRKAQNAAQRRKSSAAAAAAQRSVDQRPPETGPTQDPSPETLGASSGGEIQQAADDAGLRFAL